MVFRSILVPREEAREGRLNWKYAIRQCVKSSAFFPFLPILSSSILSSISSRRFFSSTVSWMETNKLGKRNVSRVNLINLIINNNNN